MEGFKNKRILFICRETYSKPLWFLAKEYVRDNEVAAFYIMSTECCYNKCLYNENTIYQFKENLKEVKLYDVADICHKYTEDLKNKPKNPIRYGNIYLFVSQLFARYSRKKGIPIWKRFMGSEICGRVWR